MRSVNEQAPWLGPGFPNYPIVSQVVRVYGGVVVRASPGLIYRGYVQQWTPTLNLRDRENIYVWEPNGIALASGYYDGRLVGTYDGLPLLVTWCCPLPSSSSSLASQASQASGEPSLSSG